MGHCCQDRTKFVPDGGYATFFTLAFTTVLSLFGEVKAVTINAKSISHADVSSAVASAKDGDTVIVPAGTSTWRTYLMISNSITLQGAGAGSTVIIDEVSDVASKPSVQRAVRPVRNSRPAKGLNSMPEQARKRQSFLISITLARDLPFRMSGFTFKGGAGPTARSFNGKIKINGNSHSVRVDHCTFDSLNGTALEISGFIWGVIDHCLFNSIVSHPIIVGHKTWNGGNWGHGSWADDPHWGSEKFVFIEDNVFEGGGGIDSFEGARFVVRYNQFHNCGLVMHGTEGQGRGAKQLEEYHNTYVFDSADAAGQIRSGCIITHDNTWSSVAKGHVLQAYRPFRYSRHWGFANGENGYDDNAPNGRTGYWATGTHTGASNSTTLTDSNAKKTWWDEGGVPQAGAWPVNRWYGPGVTYIVRNMTQEAVAKNENDKIQSFILANTANTITCSSKNFPKLKFDAGDTYQIWKVVHSLDQPGLGKGDLLAGLPGLPAKWPHQAPEPCYSWNNTQAGAARHLFSTVPSIKEGRDFFNGTPKPGYLPFVYPHPLVSGKSPQSFK